jgi:two-component system response regulator AlgR
MNPRVFIVDDEAPARARLTTLLSDIAAECPHELIGEAAGAQAALEQFAVARPDIVLLDIQMPGMTGIELASHLVRHYEPAPILIFITAYDEYALKAFEVHALDYLLKPVRAARLADALRRAISMCAGRTSQQQAVAATASTLGMRRQNFSIQERGRVLLVPVADVLYFRAELKYVTLRTKAREFVLEESLLSLEEEMGEQFVRVHRNTLVACNAIRGVERGTIDAEQNGDKAQESWQVIVRDIDERLPVSRRQWPIVKALLNKRA